MKKRIAILGSTGSIGRQTLDVVRSHGDAFEVTLLVANNSVDVLAQQAQTFQPRCVYIGNEDLYPALKARLDGSGVEVFTGTDTLDALVRADDIDVVVAAMVGFAGLRPTIAAIRAGKTIALANKETLVVAGEIITRLCQESGVALLPIDSEHSAILQCLQGEERTEIKTLLLTASGGPFRHLAKEELAYVTAKQALQHPNWKMGDKITIDSATMMNKGFEVMEAHWLFGVEYEKIQVVVHPQSIVHSAVQFADGAVKAQLGVPDMHLPIQYALTFPRRWACEQKALDMFTMGTLTFEKPDEERFPCLLLARQASAAGGNMPCVLNAANEAVNSAFSQNKCSFYQMSDVIAQTMAQTEFLAKPSIDDLIATDAQAREIANNLINKING